MSEVTKKPLKQNLIAVKLLGFWSPKGRLLSKLYRFYTLVIFCVFLIPVPLAAILYFVLKNNFEVTELADSAYLITEISGSMIRMLIWLKNENVIKSVICCLQNDAFNKRDVGQERFLNDASDMSFKIFRWYSLCGTAGVLAWASVPLFSEERILPLAVWYPVDPIENDVLYFIVYIHIFLGVAICTALNVSTSTLVAGLMIHTTGQVKALKSSFEQLSRYVPVTKRKRSTNTIDNITSEKISQYLEHHEQIITFTANMESAFSMFSFTQFMVGSFIICTTAFELSILSPSSFKFYWMLIYMICMLIELLLFCWFGNEMYYESSSLTDAIYASNWYNYGPKSKKALIILMERSKRPLNVRAANLFSLSMQTFSTILRRAYSLFAVLQHLNSGRYA